MVEIVGQSGLVEQRDERREPLLGALHELCGAAVREEAADRETQLLDALESRVRVGIERALDDLRELGRHARGDRRRRLDDRGHDVREGLGVVGWSSRDDLIGDRTE